MALAAGFPPASFRLEDGCLMGSATTAIEIGQRGRTCTCGHSVPGRACCCYTTRCCPGRLAPGAWFLWRWRPRSLEHILHWRFGGPEGLAPLLNGELRTKNAECGYAQDQ